MIWTPPKPILNGTHGAWQGPCWDLPELLTNAVAPVFVQNQNEWPTALAVAMAESGLATPRPGLFRVRIPAVWTGTIGDMHLANDVWGFSYGTFQIRHQRNQPVPSVDPLANCRAAHTIWAEHGWKRWSSYKSGSYRRWLPTAHRTIADYLEPKP